MEGEREVEVHVIVTGRVQGVNYRWALREQARARGVRGWVRNRPDGSVEAVLQGPEADVNAILAWMQRGPPGAAVAEVRVQPTEPQERYTGFSIRF